ncbi:MAG: carbamoyl phosphate synthase small subunit [Treponemataceae bacterium]|nr:carbamoyl phosphate synthase small subunit [Treponemataceae bacterium]
MKRYLILENGMTFEGGAFGAECPKEGVTCEIVFTTAMVGFLETLTDKSYFGQAVIQAFPLIGNYGVNLEDAESERTGCCAYIVREYCEHPSNFRSKMTIDDFLKKNGVPGLYGIDTRALVKLLCKYGTMNGIITDDPSIVDLEKVKAYEVTKAVRTMTSKASYGVDVDVPTVQEPYHVALMDFGVKSNIVRSLVKRNCCVTVLNAYTTPEEIAALNPDGIMLSNGPGDPKENVEIIENIRALTKTGIPIMGICLGHQMLALANGFDTEKLKFGHRGANQPVKDVASEKVYISTQNHGYAVKSDSIDPSVAEQLFINVNDNSNEGIRYKNIPAFSVQFHPEACAGPKDTSYLFDDFIALMEKKHNA